MACRRAEQSQLGKGVDGKIALAAVVLPVTQSLCNAYANHFKGLWGPQPSAHGDIKMSGLTGKRGCLHLSGRRTGLWCLLHMFYWLVLYHQFGRCVEGCQQLATQGHGV